MKLAMTVSILATLATAAGCAEHTQPDKEFAMTEGTLRSPQRVADIQQANGARDDRNLYAVHFTDDGLNSLGRAKLDAMLQHDESVRPMTIHLATGSQDVQMRRIESVTAYLKDNGLTESQMRFETGLSEGSYHPSAEGLANLHKTDTDSVTPGVGNGGATLVAPSGMSTTR